MMWLKRPQEMMNLTMSEEEGEKEKRKSGKERLVVKSYKKQGIKH